MESIPSPNFTPASASRANYGQPRTFETIIIHWWDAPANRPKIESVIARFLNPASQVSAHYVVDDSRTVRMVDEENIAWHAKQANPIAIGIECDPNGGEAMYARLGSLVREIRSRRGQLPLEPHNKYVSTQCPGWIDLARIDGLAKQIQGEIMDRETVNWAYRDALDQEPSKEQLSWWVGRPAKELLTALYKDDAAKNFRHKATHYEGVLRQLSDATKQAASQQRQIETLNKQVEVLEESLAEAIKTPERPVMPSTIEYQKSSLFDFSTLAGQAKAIVAGFSGFLIAAGIDPAIVTNPGKEGWKGVAAYVLSHVLVYATKNKVK